MPLFHTDKFQRLAELEARVQKAIEEAGAGGLDWAEDELARVAGTAGFDLAAARLLDADSLEAVLGAGEEADPGRLWLAAEALRVDGVVAAAEGRDDDARDRLEKALRLYRRVPEGVRLPDAAATREDRLREVGERLTGGDGATTDGVP